MGQSRDPKKHKPGEVVDGEIIAEFEDETLMNLPNMEGSGLHEQVSAPQVKLTEPDLARRQLIIRLLLGSGAALAIGGSAALLMNRKTSQSVVVLPNGAQIGADGNVDVAQILRQLSDAQNQLASVQSERDQLRTQLDTANAQLAEIQPQMDRLTSLNKLWADLDAIGLDDTLSGAISVASGAFTVLKGFVDSLRSGLTDAQESFDSFVRSIPGPQEGVKWLQDQMRSLKQTLDDLGTLVKQAVEPVEPFAQLVANFIAWVLNWLPLTPASRARAGMESMQSIIANLPLMIDGVNNTVLTPLASWFSSDPLKNLSGILLDPISKQVFAPAKSVADQMVAFEDAFSNKLIQPVTDALSRRAEIRAQIKQTEGERLTGLRKF